MFTYLLPLQTEATFEEEATRVLTKAGTIEELKLISSNWILAYISRYVIIKNLNRMTASRSKIRSKYKKVHTNGYLF